MTFPRESVGRVAVPWLSLSVCLSCAPARPVPWPAATARSWNELGRALSEQRQSRPREPWSAGLRITMRDPASGRVIDGRGAIAVEPGQAVRMILTGAAGATMLDAWVTQARWRVAVPPLEIVRRGGLEEPRDMPVGFLRWWFLTPLTGRLFAATFTEGGSLWLLRYGNAVIELREASCPRGTLLHATRRAVGHAETVEECRERGEPSAGDSARYVDEASGLCVDVSLESIAAAPPSGDAFRDPDALGSGT
jgi:hypothetical protein